MRISDLVITSDFVSDTDFENCQIVGPAVVVLLGEGTIAESTFIGNPDAMLWPVPPARQEVIGVIPITNCNFVRCRFEKIGIAGPEAALAPFREIQMLPDPLQ